MSISPVPQILPVFTLKPQSPMLDIVIANIEAARADDVLRGVEDSTALPRTVEPREGDPATLDRRA